MSFGWNLPPGVTGFEPEIAGYPDEHIEFVDFDCTANECGEPNYGIEVVVDHNSLQPVEVTCEVCGHKQEFDIDAWLDKQFTDYYEDRYL